MSEPEAVINARLFWIAAFVISALWLGLFSRPLYGLLKRAQHKPDFPPYVAGVFTGLAFLGLTEHIIFALIAAWGLLLSSGLWISRGQVRQ